MDLKNEKRLFELLYRLVVRGKCAKEKTPYYPQKTECCTNVSDAPSLELYSPESVGVSSEYITSLLKELEKSSEYLHTVVILCKGKKIAEAAAPGYSTHRRHVTHSLAKSVTLLAVGMLVDEGRLKLSDLACELLGVKASSKTHSITVEDLLTMRTNVVFSEVLGAVTEDNWIKAFFSSSVKNEPGTGFAYNSMNSYILSAIVQKLTGQNLSEYLRPRLWEPLGITNIFWEKCPHGIDKGGWGLYISTEDMAKIGQLVLQKGVWNDKRLISESWLSVATTPHVLLPENQAHFDYGYQLWVSADRNGILFNGMFGQNVWVCPKTEWVVSYNSGTDEMFLHNGALAAVMNYSSDACSTMPEPLPESPKQLEKLRNASESFMSSRNWLRLPTKIECSGALTNTPRVNIEKTIKGFLGNWRTRENNIGFLPLVMRVLQNNHSKGINSISLLQRSPSELTLITNEGDEKTSINIGFERYTENLINYRGEPYRVLAAAQFSKTDNNRPVLKIDIKFPEHSSTRRMMFYPDSNNMRIRLSETPGVTVFSNLTNVTHLVMPYFTALIDKLRPSFLHTSIPKKFKSAFSPTIIATRIEPNNL